jgi:hypothetical protein
MASKYGNAKHRYSDIVFDDGTCIRFYHALMRGAHLLNSLLNAFAVGCLAAVLVSLVASKSVFQIRGNPRLRELSTVISRILAAGRPVYKTLGQAFWAG